MAKKNNIMPKNKKILVTGGTGFIGSHTVVALIEAGYRVVIVDNLERSDIRVMDGIRQIIGYEPEFYNTDLRDRQAVKHLFNKNPDINGIIHFAAFKAVGESVEKPLLYYYNNLVSLMHLLENMEMHKISNIVFSSSCTVYGQPEKLPVDETAPIIEAESPYGNTKQISEEILKDMTASSDIKTISLRYFNPIGAHESALIGELPIGVPDNLIPYVTQSAIGKRKAITVFGDNYPTTDGTCVRDYIHVVDLAEAHVIAMNRLLNKTSDDKFEVFNLGTGQGNSVLEVLNTFIKVTGVDLKYNIGPRRPGDVAMVYADTLKANKVLGWKAKRSLDEMLSSAWKWEKQISGDMENTLNPK